LYQAWNKAYPVEPWERQRNQRVACVMGWGNSHVSQVDMSRCARKRI
ncbi:MAG: deoxyribonuclease, partial [Pseudomonadales bacterium]